MMERRQRAAPSTDENIAAPSLMFQCFQRTSRHARGLMLPAAVLLLLLVGDVAGGSEEARCTIVDGRVSPSCLNQPASKPPQLVTATVPLDLRVQWRQGHGYCGEVSVQMVAAHHGVWVSQQLVRDLNHGELLVDSSGSVERVLDTLGFAHTTWRAVPPQHQLAAAAQDYSSHAVLFTVWMKQNIAQGRVPIFGAKVYGEFDPEFDHIQPAYSVQFLSNSGSNMVDATGSAAYTPDAGVALFEGVAGKHANPAAVAQLTFAAAALCEAGAAVSRLAAAADAESARQADSDDDGDDDSEAGDESAESADVSDSSSAFDSAVMREEAEQEPLVMQPAGSPHAAGWLPAPAQNLLLRSLPGLYSFSTTDVFGWTNDYGAEVKRAGTAPGFFAGRSGCQQTDEEGGCISTDSPSYAVAMGGLVQPPAATAADSGTAAATEARYPGEGVVLAAALHSLFQPLRLTITAWSTAGVAASAEPPARLKASATGYQLDVSGCAELGQPFTVFRFDGVAAFRATGQQDSQGRQMLDNPQSVAELSSRCAAHQQACRRATFVQTAGLSVGAREFGPFAAYDATYFVCVEGVAAR